MSDPSGKQTAAAVSAQKAVWWLQAVALRSLWWLTGRMSPEQATASGARLMTLLGSRSSKHRHVLANLRMVCPDRSPAEIERLARGVWGNIGAVLAEFALLEELTSPAHWQDRIEVVNNTGDPDFFERPLPRVIVGVHLANWELLAWAGQRISAGCDAMYNPQKNPALEKLVQQRRSCIGCDYVGKANSTRRLLNSLKNGRSVGLLIDVRVDGGQRLPFCGADASVTTLPARLALKAGCEIVPIRVERLPGTRFRVAYQRPLQARSETGETRDQAVLRISRELNAAVESWIQARPQEWWCTKRRWPKEIMDAHGAYRD